ncbi:hypothetical protein GCM10012287_30100 [Streptomyces daqingensis]|uniref:Uncharacterized protein n=1 Tax=Streptomyces daqingensis TaxID=1472640 RepID=A0ABQ2MF69_9ACTN|nr:hypothetical protein GCM10012287_30100 [Streptomyces daqingensis]
MDKPADPRVFGPEYAPTLDVESERYMPEVHDSPEERAERDHRLLQRDLYGLRS